MNDIDCVVVISFVFVITKKIFFPFEYLYTGKILYFCTGITNALCDPINHTFFEYFNVLQLNTIYQYNFDIFFVPFVLFVFLVLILSPSFYPSLFCRSVPFSLSLLHV